MIKRHPPCRSGSWAPLNHAAPGNASRGVHIHSGTAGWAHKADVSTSLLCPFCADFLSLLASATWATANHRDVYGCTHRRKTRPRRRAEYHAKQRLCAVWPIDSSKTRVLTLYCQARWARRGVTGWPGRWNSAEKGCSRHLRRCLRSIGGSPSCHSSKQSDPCLSTKLPGTCCPRAVPPKWKRPWPWALSLSVPANSPSWA